MTPSSEIYKARSKRINQHNRKIREMRARGELPPFGMRTYSQIVKKAVHEPFMETKFKKVSKNGSLIPNKFALWQPPFDTYTSKDF